MLIVFIEVFITCQRSIDLKFDESVGKRFFDVPADASSAAKATAASIKKQNNYKHFVKELVKKVGYPRWNNTME